MRVLVLLSALLCGWVYAAEPVAVDGWSGAAIGGHDTVAYHSQPKAEHVAQPGKSKFEVEYKGATWRFATAEHAAEFAADPARYSPAYNGFCANALSLGEGLIRTDGTVWQIFDGQLFTYYAERGRKRWLKGDVAAYKREADAAWESILSQQ